MQNALSDTLPLTSNKQNLFANGWVIWGFAALFYAYEFIHRVSPSVMVSDMMSDFMVDRTLLGNLSAYYFYAYALCQVPAGMICDRFGIRVVLTLACLITALGSIVFSFAESVTCASISRFCIGAGSAFGFVSCLKLASLWIKNKYFPLIVGLTNLCGVIGAILGGGPLAHLLTIMTWRETLLTLGFIGIFLSTLLWFTIRDKGPSRLISSHPTHALSYTLRFVLFKPRTWVIAIYGMCMVAPMVAFAELWGIEFFQASYCITKEYAASLFAYIFIGVAIGSPIIGALASKLGKPRLLMLFAAFTALTMLCGVIYIDGIPFFWMKIMLLVFGFATTHMLLCFSMVNSAYPSWANGTALGFINMMIMGGSALFQPLIGYLLDSLIHISGHLVYNQASLIEFRYALSVLPLCIIFGIGLLTFFEKKNKKRGMH